MNGTVERAITSSKMWDEVYHTLPHSEIEDEVRGPLLERGWCVLNRDTCDVLRAMPDETIDLILADPPYGVNFQSRGRAGTGQELRFEKIANDKAPFIWWLRDAYRVTKPTGAMICFTRWDVRDFWIQAVEAAGWDVKGEVIWDKMQVGMGNLTQQFTPIHETIIFACKDDFAFPAKRPKSVISVPKIPMQAYTHPNEKPVGLMDRLILSLTREGDVVLDPFSGSGVVGESAVRNKRWYIGIDVDKHYATLGTTRIDKAYQGRLRKERMS